MVQDSINKLYLNDLLSIYFFAALGMENILLEEALNESTPLERLLELANSGEEDVCKGVASNPNASPNLLIHLFRKCPVEVLNNPVLDVILLERPNFLEQLFKSNCSVLNKERLPEFYVNWVSNHQENWIRTFVAEGRYTPPDILAKLSQDPSLKVRQTVASNTATPIDVLENLASDNLSQIRYYVALNQNTPILVLKRLADDKVCRIRCAVAKNKLASCEIIAKLSNDNEVAVRKALANNTTTPVIYLEKLGCDENKSVRLCIARNTVSPVSLLEKLSTDPFLHTRIAVVRNLNTPDSLLEKLQLDNDKSVRRVATKCLQIRRNVI